MARNRGFISAKEMEGCIVDNFNSTVSKRDTFFHLGDFYWTNNMEGIRKFIAKLNCKKIIFLKGNHDKPLIKFMKATKNSRLELHSDYFLKDNGCNLHLYHYPVEDWVGMIKKDKNGNRIGGSYMLHGHEHSDCEIVNRKMSRRLNVNIELHNYRPLCVDDITSLC